MGATGWKYFVPYEADFNVALQRLRENVFDAGEYLSGIGRTRPDMEAALKVCGADIESVLRRFTAQASDPKLSAQTRKKFAALVQQLKHNKSDTLAASPTTIEELLERQGESGTHSILDIVRVSDAPEFGAVSPLTCVQLVDLFGTEKPSHAQIENKYEEGALEEYVRERWQGVYIIAFRDGLPDEIFFAGCSGD
jgi:hypothetical protein